MKIAFVLLNNMLATSAINPLELWNAAKQASRVQKHLPPPFSSASVPADIRLIKVGNDLQKVSFESGIELTPDNALDSTRYDVVYIPAIWRNPRLVVKRNAKLIDWIRQQYSGGAVLNATGSGVHLIAESGLLNNQPATTHWHYFDQFELDYPEVILKRQHAITSAGRIHCAGSINAQTDLTIHHVHRFLGKEVAQHLSKHFSPEVRQPFDRLNFDQADGGLHADEDILQIQMWLQNNLSNIRISLKSLAKNFSLSQRSLNRRFLKATGMTPVKYLQKIRYDMACDLLTKTNLSIAEVAYRVGYVDSSYFGKHFRLLSSMSPLAYRTARRPKLFNVDVY
ncbi:MAG: helix-turn-helix domain-containing protein [Pseudomonadota bacterium]